MIKDKKPLEFLLKEQYKLKLEPFYYIFSKENIIIIFLSLLLTNNPANFLIIFVILSLIGYRFIFKLTRAGNQYQPILLKMLAKLHKKIKLSMLEKKLKR